MPSSTAPPWSLPYPIGSDPVADGDNAIRALAERTHVDLATIQTAATLVQGTINYPAGITDRGATRVYRAGHTVYVNIDLNIGVSIAADGVLFQVNWIPAMIWLGVAKVSGAAAIGVVVDGSGLVKAQEAINAGVAFYGSVVFPTNTTTAELHDDDDESF